MSTYNQGFARDLERQTGFPAGIAETGGNCLAIQINAPSGAYVLVTSTDAGLPIDDSGRLPMGIMVGAYSAEGEFDEESGDLYDSADYPDSSGVAHLDSAFHAVIAWANRNR